MACCGHGGDSIGGNGGHLGEMRVAAVGSVSRGGRGEVQHGGGVLLLEHLMRGQLEERCLRRFDLWKEWEHHLLDGTESSTHSFLADRGLLSLGQHWDSLMDHCRAPVSS